MSKYIQSLKAKLKNIAREKNIEFNSVMRSYMYERFVERLSLSEYRDNFVIKGGFYVSTLFGIDRRSTMDIDTAILKAEFTEEKILEMISKIIHIDAKDNAVFEVVKNESIREEDEYGGLRVHLRFQLEEYNDGFYIDVATGDPIHPGPINYGYKSLLEDKEYKVWTYSIETVLAEKIETIFSKLESSSRMKDYYDIYLIYNNEFKSLNVDDFRVAVEKTFKKRQFTGDLEKGLDIIKNSDKLHMYWKAYARKNKFVGDVTFEDTIKCLEEFASVLIEK